MINFDKDEYLIYEVRKHWIVFVTEITFLVLLALAPTLIMSFIQGQVEVPLIVFGYTLWLLILWVLAFVFWTNYYLDVWIITNKKVIDVEQHGLFKREISVMHLEKIQDVTYETTGMIATLMNFGNLEVQTAGSEGNFPIKGVPNPALVQAKMNEAVIANRKLHKIEEKK